MIQQDVQRSSPAALHAWLQPVGSNGLPCGPDVEYEDDFLELLRAANGKPPSQFSPGEPPDWVLVRDKAETLLARTRDLRVAVYWTRAGVNLRGFAALEPGLVLVQGLLEAFWDHVHPLPDPTDRDLDARANALSTLSHSDGLCGDLKRAVFFNAPALGEIRLRSVAIAWGQLSARADETSYTKEQLGQLMLAAIRQEPGLADMTRSALLVARALSATVNEKFGAALAPDLKPLLDLIQLADRAVPAAPAAVAEPAANGATTPGPPAPIQVRREGGGSLDCITSRDEALRAIDLVCEFLERAEPSSPAQMLLRRARRLVNQDFLQLIKELAPDALPEAARVLGVDPDSVAAP